MPNADHATRRRNLRTGSPVWAEAGGASVRHHRAPRNKDYDVVIVGSGISGAFCAYEICNDRRRVAMLDRRPPITGSTLASTAMIQHEIDQPLSRLQKAMKPAAARRAWKRSAEAVRRIIDICRRENFDCGFREKKALYLAGDEMGLRGLKAECAAREAVGLDCEFIDGASLLDEYGIDRTGALVSTPSASANPAQLTAELIRAAQRRGLEVVSPVEVIDFMASADEVALALNTGEILRAGAAVFSTGYEFLSGLESSRHAIVSTWAISAHARTPLPPWMSDFVVWEASDPYLYFRTHPDGSVVIGGEDEPYESRHQNQKILASKSRTLVRKFEELTGVSLYPPQSHWAAAFGETSTGLPFLGKAPGASNVYVTMGFGGNGITFSQIGADIIRCSLDGATDEDEQLFAFPQR